jgi:hypothetical protein
LDDLSDEQRKSVLLKSKIAEAKDKRQAVKDEYAKTLKQTHEALAKRREELREDLYSIKDPTLLTRAVLASEEDLKSLTAAALQVGESGADLLKACLVAGERRGLGDILSTIFQERPDLQDLYHEWNALPPKEVLERQAQNVDAILPAPTIDRLTPPTTVRAY